MEGYITPLGYGEEEIIEKKSRFIGRIWHVSSQDEALERIKETRNKHWDASHNVYAYIIRKEGVMRYSDDGEPQGTAGMPVLEVLRREEVTDVCAVVTRYFGGTLLGAGGLIRAYAKSAKMALNAAGRQLWKKWMLVRVICPYSMFEKLKAALPAMEGLEKETIFGAEVDIFVYFPEGKYRDAIENITDLTSGQTVCTVESEEFMGVKIEGR